MIPGKSDPQFRGKARIPEKLGDGTRSCIQGRCTLDIAAFLGDVPGQGKIITLSQRITVDSFPHPLKTARSFIQSSTDPVSPTHCHQRKPDPVIKPQLHGHLERLLIGRQGRFKVPSGKVDPC